MTWTPRHLATPPRLLAIGVATFITGRLLDAWWHAGHDEFESGTDQVQAHWLVWLATLLILATTSLSASSGSQPKPRGV